MNIGSGIYYGIASPILGVVMLYFLIDAIRTKVVSRTLYLPDFPLKTKPIGYYFSISYMIALMILAILGTINFTFKIPLSIF